MSEETPAYSGRYIPSAAERQALERLLVIAKFDVECPAGRFLLAWMDPARTGGFDMNQLWATETAVTNDMLTVCGLISRARCAPAEIGYAKDFARLIELWQARR